MRERVKWVLRNGLNDQLTKNQKMFNLFPMLVACVTSPQHAEQIGGLADLIEYRFDCFPDLSAWKKPALPAIFTFRRKDQGGKSELSESERWAFLEKALEWEPAYCDIEADTDPTFIEKIGKKFPHVKLIGSYHNFTETPSDLHQLLEGMKNPRFSVYKIAMTAQSTIDLLRLLVFAQEATVPLAAIAMGEWGKPSRVLGPIVGNVFDYAGLEEDSILHRYSLQTLHEVFRYRRLNRQTRIYALLGDPVEQSPGHLFHNARFQQNGVYVKFRLRPEELADFFSLIKKLPFAGFSVTRPLKEAILPFLDEISPAAQAIGAVNTITISDRIRGANTDAPGALNAIEKHLDVKGKRIALLGAGGSARAIAFEALQRGAIVTAFNRTAKEFLCPLLPFKELSRYSYDILINTVPQLGDLPILSPKTAVMDIVYHPRETPLLAAAKEQGCLCIYGDEMFLEQALLQQKEWF